MYLVKVLIKNQNYEYESNEIVIYKVIQDIRNKIFSSLKIKHNYHIYDIKKIIT